MRCFGDVIDDVPQNAKHRANDASNDVNCPPLLGCAFEFLDLKQTNELQANTWRPLRVNSIGVSVCALLQQGKSKHTVFSLSLLA